MSWKSVFLFISINILGLTIAAKDWWENGNFYQIYPRSMKDSNDDGIGDLIGITEKLQYISDIGMNGVWLSPIFKSPMADFGYDISDYYQVQDEYGTNEDLVVLLEKAHELGLRIILDFVPNHTSDEHVWFIKSVNGDAQYRDYYIWHDGVINTTTGERSAPSNWISVFRNSAWEWNEKRQQYYLHQFGVKQPDLNFRNPVVLEETKNIMRYWLQKGVDGFRIDAIPYFYETDIDAETGTYPDEPVTADVNSCPDPNDPCHLNHIHTRSKWESIELVYEWREVVDKWQREHNTDTKIIMTEAYTEFEKLMLLYGDGIRNGSHVPFNFEMLGGLNNQSSVEDYVYYPQHWLDNMPGGVYANWVLGNHDNRRVASRFGPQRKDLLNIYLQTLPGISVTYNGDEYGAEDVYISYEETVDLQACNAGKANFEKSTRDPVRTPFRWDSSKNAGFSTADKTWLPVGAGYESENVANQLAADNSHLRIFMNLVKLRQEPAFQDGSYEVTTVQDAIIYTRQAATGDAFIIVLNIGEKHININLTALYAGLTDKVEVAVSSLHSGIPNGALVDTSSFEAKPYNGYVLRVSES